MYISTSVFHFVLFLNSILELYFIWLKYFIPSIHIAAVLIASNPDSKVHGANMGPIWGRQYPRGPHVGHENLAIWDYIVCLIRNHEVVAQITSKTLLGNGSWWRHQMKTFPALLALCEGKSPVIGEFPSQRPVVRSFDVFFDLHPNKRLSKNSKCWWFETPSRSLWRHSNVHWYL